jgi:hypothetical protein
MGIYVSGTLYGIRIHTINEEGHSNIVYEKQYEERMTVEQKREVQTEYEMLDKNDIFLFEIYTECISTYEKENETCLMWYPISIQSFLEIFLYVN